MPAIEEIGTDTFDPKFVEARRRGIAFEKLVSRSNPATYFMPIGNGRFRIHKVTEVTCTGSGETHVTIPNPETFQDYNTDPPQTPKVPVKIHANSLNLRLGPPEKWGLEEKSEIPSMTYNNIPMSPQVILRMRGITDEEANELVLRVLEPSGH